MMTKTGDMSPPTLSPPLKSKSQLDEQVFSCSKHVGRIEFMFNTT